MGEVMVNPGASSQEEEEEEHLDGGSGEISSCGADKAGEGSLAPWEQHASVIILPRYDYGAPSSLLQRSHSGFLITCPIKREKSATKEAISLLEEYIYSMYSNGSKPKDPDAAAKRRKVCYQLVNEKNVEDRETNDTALKDSGNVARDSSFLSIEKSENAKRSSLLSLVKLSRSGLLFFSFPNNGFHHVVEILSNIFLSLKRGKLKTPLWCHRIFPIQETCMLTEKGIEAVVSQLFQKFVENEDKLDEPIKFAVGYNRRGIDEAEIRAHRNTEFSEKMNLMDREHCFRVVAAAVKAVAKNAVVDLKSPEVAVLVELLPLSGAPHGSPVVGVSVLPAGLLSTKPRLSVKSLVNDAKSTKTRK